MKKRLYFKTALLLPLLLLSISIPYSARTVLAADTINKNIADGNIIITDSTPYNISGTSKATVDALNTITPAHMISVDEGVTANVTISNLTINQCEPVDDGNFLAAIYVNSNATLNLTLANGSSNSLTGGRYLPAILVAEGATLNITADSYAGLLYAKGGKLAAGIGTGYSTLHGQIGYTDIGTINIAAGIITSIGGMGGAGIGTGEAVDTPVDCHNITISGGDITAVGGDYAAGIGGGEYSYLTGSINISGGRVTADAGDYYTVSIGPGDQNVTNSSFSGGTINLTGGTIISKDEIIGSGSNVYISGGSIDAGGFSNTPCVSSSDNRQVYKNTICVPNNKNHSISSLLLKLDGSDYPYGYNGMYANSKGEIYLYLPNSTAATADITTNLGSYNGFYQSGTNHTLKLDQSPLLVTGISSKYAAGSSINPSASGGSGSGDVSYTYTGRNGTSYGPSTTAPTTLGDYSVSAKKVGDNSYYEATSTAFDFSIISLTIEGIPGQTYTGSAIEPNLTVKDGTNTLTEGTDYTVSFSDNSNAGTATGTVTGNNSYAGFVSDFTFTIIPKVITFSVDSLADKTYTGSAIEPVPVVKDGTTVLVKDTDYEVSYTANVQTGTASVTVSGKGNYAGSNGSGSFTITPKVTTLTIEPIAAQTYSGGNLEPAVTVKDGTITLLQGTDYTVAYSHNCNAGTAGVSITGAGNYVGSSGNGSFTIKPKTVTFDVWISGPVTYTGNEIKPVVKVKDGSQILTLDSDYNISYSGNINAGSATASVVGIGNYFGSITTYSFSINPKVTTFTIESIADQTYTGSEIEPSVVVRDGATTLTQNVDYDVSYTKNVNTGIAEVTVTGMGNYAGSTGNGSFTIVGKAVTLAIEPISEVTYTGSSLEPSLVVKDGTKTLTKGTDYTVSFSDNTNAGTASVTITGVGNYVGSTGSASFTIKKCGNFAIHAILDQTYTGTALEPIPTVEDVNGNILVENVDFTIQYNNNQNVGTANISIHGINNYTGNTSKSFAVKERQISIVLTPTESGLIQDDVTLTAKLINVVDLPTGTITFYVDGTSIADHVPVVYENGEYKAKTVWNKVPGGSYDLTASYIPAANDNYIATADGVITDYSITKKEQTGFTGTNMFKTFGDAAFTLSTEGGQSSGAVTYEVTSGTDVIALSGNQISIIKAGKAVVTATKSGDFRYNPAVTTLVIQINKAATSITSLPKAAAITINNPLSSSSLTQGEGNVAGRFVWSYPEQVVSSSGQYEVTFIPEDTINYLTCSGLVDVTINFPYYPASDSGAVLEIGDGTNNPIVENNKEKTSPEKTTMTEATDANETDGNGNDEENSTDSQNKPYIIGDKGVEGWSSIIKEINEKAAIGTDKTTVKVEMNGTTTVTREVLQAIQGNNVDLVLDMGNGISWTINGLAIQDIALKDINLGVAIDTDKIPVDIINNITGEKSTMQISLDYSGEFGFAITMNINLNAENAGYYANLYYYNPKTSSMDFVTSNKIDENGNAELGFTHASDYAIVINEKDLNPNNNAAEGKQSSEVKVSEKRNPMYLYVIAIIGGIAVMGGGMAYVITKRKK